MAQSIFAASLDQKLRLTKKDFIDALSKNLGHTPTAGQLRLFEHIITFLAGHNPSEVFVLKGYAGTGKTSMVRSLVKTLPLTSIKTVLMAPTGRAAKVLSAYSGQTAWTIHKRIYFSTIANGRMHFALQRNMYHKTLFIVDEASMIGGDNAETEQSLLDDLLAYVQSGNDCRLMLIGDDAQLPPVGLAESPAIDVKILKQQHYLRPAEVKLTEVVRQESNSGILWNATRIRDQIQLGESAFPSLQTLQFSDIRRITGMDLEECLNQAYAKYGTEEVLVITRSNKNAVLYNRQIRARIRWQDNDISSGDHLMIVRNNYFWLPEDSGPGFIANGDTVEVQRLGKRYERGGFHFVDAQVRLLEYPDQPDLEVKLWLDSLDSEQANMNFTQLKQLQQEIEGDYAHIPLKADRNRAMKKDPFLNALQVKFAYAVTCHKAQGGQWKCVFVDQGFLTEEMLDVSLLRWLYTAVTRATEQLYLVNFHKDFFPDEPVDVF